jgi:cytochrome c-type biogenesis protein CcmH
MAIIITLVAFILLVLAIVWGHFLSRRPTKSLNNEKVRDNTNVELYHEHKNEIEQDFQQGNIDDENYQYLLTELDKGLLQDISENEASSKEVNAVHSLSVIWPMVISLFILSLSLFIYTELGAFDRLSQPQVAPGQHAQATEQQKAQIAQLDSLVKQLDAAPENSELWYSYGQALIGIGNFQGAIKAFDKVIDIEGVHADLLGAKAQASYYQNNQQLTPEVQEIINQALAIDPQDASTNILLGMHAFTEQKYQQAINFWQKVLAGNRGNVNVAAINQAIDEAKGRLSLTSSSNSVTPSNEQAIENNVSATSTGPQLTLNVDLSDNIRAAMIDSPDKTVFVYAIPANGARMPLAAVKMMASDLPTTIVLTDANAMTPQMKLSSVEQVHIFAVISKAGTPGIKSGDFKGELNDVAVSTSTALTLSIDVIVP